jgi:hypothetical protein
LGFPPRGKGKSRNGSRNQRRRDRNLAYSDRH